LYPIKSKSELHPHRINREAAAAVAPVKHLPSTIAAEELPRLQMRPGQGKSFVGVSVRFQRLYSGCRLLLIRIQRR
jgi:hypothetical protein